MIMALSIQLKWLIEENAKILRRDVWFKPPEDPTTSDNMAEKMTKLEIAGW